MTVSYIIATIGRPSLADTLASIECWPGDEVIVIGNVVSRTEGHIRYIACPPGHDWGSTERNIAMPLARGDYLAHIDDDDVYAPGARAAMEDAMTSAPGHLAIFRMRYANGFTLWHEPAIRYGNVGTPMIFMPNQPTKLGRWGEQMDGGDFHFLQTMEFRRDQIVWHPQVIALVKEAHR